MPVTPISVALATGLAPSHPSASVRSEVEFAKNPYATRILAGETGGTEGATLLTYRQAALDFPLMSSPSLI